MNDEELGRLLRDSLGNRRAPGDAKERILARLRRRPLNWLAAAAALVALGALGMLFHALSGAVPAAVAAAVEQHLRSDASGHAASASTPREVSGIVGEALDRPVELPGLRDAGLAPIDAHRCGPLGGAHVIYANSWLKLSCFILPGERVPLSGGSRVSQGDLEGTLYRGDGAAALAVRDGNLVKLWVADLRPGHLASIAFDAERKRSRLQTTVLRMPGGAVRPAGAILMNTPGVEDCRAEAAGGQMAVVFDQKRVSLDEIAAVLVLNGIEATPRDWEGR